MIAINHPEAKEKHKNENLPYFFYAREDAVGILGPFVFFFFFFKKRVPINQVPLHKVFVAGL